MTAGRDAEFVAFVDAHGARLRGMAYLLAGNSAEAADLYQETLTKMYVAWPRITKSGAHLAYARSTMTRELISWRRRASWRREVISDELPEIATRLSPEDSSDVVLTALRQLPPRQRAVVVLRYYCDWSEKQTADALGCSIGTVKTQASRGLARLRGDETLVALGGETNA